MFDCRPGSVVALFVVIYLTNDNNATWPLKNAVSKGKLGDLTVDTKSLKIKDGKSFLPRSQTTRGSVVYHIPFTLIQLNQRHPCQVEFQPIR